MPIPELSSGVPADSRRSQRHCRHNGWTIPYIPTSESLGTPAIDNGTLYVVAETAEQNATVFPHRLHALDLATGQEKFGGPAVISYPEPAHCPTNSSGPGLRLPTAPCMSPLEASATRPHKGLVFAFHIPPSRSKTFGSARPRATAAESGWAAALQCRQLRQYLCPDWQRLRRWRLVTSAKAPSSLAQPSEA